MRGPGGSKDKGRSWRREYFLHDRRLKELGDLLYIDLSPKESEWGSITTRPLAFPGSFIGINTKGYLPRCGVISPQGQMPTRAFEQTSDLFVPPGFV